MKTWVVLSACQTWGLAHSLAFLNPDVEVTFCDWATLAKSLWEWTPRLPSFEWIFVSPELKASNIIDFSAYENVITIPTLAFGAYHPDLCYVYANDLPVRSPLHDENSIVVMAAFKKGLNERDTSRLFRSEIFEAAGYFDVWDQEKAYLLAAFEMHKFNIGSSFVKWACSDAFMYTLNHPKIDCLYDIATLVTERLGRVPFLGYLRPHDNLLSGPVFPVYPEIADQYSIQGGYQFKAAGSFKLLDLDQFVAGSFQAYRAHDPEALILNPSLDERSRVGMQSRLEAVMATI